VPKSGGALVELTHLPATVPALSRAELQTLIDTDLTTALMRGRQDLARDPRAAAFDAAWLNATGYAYIQRNLRDRAIVTFTLMTEAYPRSANAFDSYSEALEGAGQRADALAAAEKALALLGADTTVAAAERAPLEAALKARIGRLR
jgi:tetratricopeptide (TPR) repeat protein